MKNNYSLRSLLFVSSILLLSTLSKSGGLQAQCNPLVVTTSPAGGRVCTGASVVLTASGLNTYTWTGGVSNGVAFTANTSTSYTITGTSTGACPGTFSKVVRVNVTTPPTQQSISPASANLVCSGNTIVTLGSTQANTYYYLRNDANNDVVSGPVAGTTGAISLGTGNIAAATTFNVKAVNASGTLYFDAFDDYVAINNPMSTTGNFTWEAWFKSSGDGSIMNLSPASGNYNVGGKTLYISSGKLTFHCYGITYMEMPGYLASVNDNKWHHVALTNNADYSGTLDRTTMYLDGQLVQVKSDWDITSSQGAGLINKIGYTSSNFPSTPAFNGAIDEVKFWSTARTQAEIFTDMSACSVNAPAGLEAYYNFEDGAGTSMADNATGLHPGVLVNMSNNWVNEGREVCSSCSTEMTTKPAVTLSALTQQAVSVLTPSFCSSGSTSVSVAGSEMNTNYYLSNSTNTSVSGPVAGNGSALIYNTGVLNNTTTYTITAKKLSGALNFDGVDDIISVNETPALAQFSTTPMTMEAWVYPTNISTIKSVIRKEGSYNLYLNNGRIYFEMYRNLGGGTNYTITLGQTILPVNQWSHIAASWQGGIYADIFLNGNQEIIGGGSSTNNNVGPLSIGRTPVSNQPFVGKLDDIRIWNTARTGAQIKANMRSCLTGSEAGLLLNYKMEDAGTTIIDAAGGDNNGVLLNANLATIYDIGVDNCGCTLQMATMPTVTVYATPVIAVANSVICSGNSAVIIPSGAGTGGIYNITGGTFTVSPGSQTNYSVVGTNSAGCAASNTAVATISVNISPTVSAASGSICSGQVFNIVPSGATGYNITGGTYNVSPSVTTSYSVTGISNGCISSNTMVTTVTVSASPTLSINSATICSGNAAVLIPSGADNYTITGGSYTVSPGSTTSYSLRGSSNAGCAATNTAVSTVSVNATPTITANSATICSGNSVSIVPTGANSYTITGNSFTVTPNATTSYTVGGTSNGCASNTIVSTVSVNITPTLTVNSGTICSGSSFAIVPAGAGSYTITGGSFTVSPTTTTSYTITGTGVNGCGAVNTVVSTVSVNTTPTLTVNSATICSGNSVAIVPTGADSYTISGGNYTVSPNVTTSYSVTGTAANGCAASNTAVSTISVNTTPTLAVNSATICSGNSFAIVPTGANSYTITGGSFTVSPNTTTAYSVTGTSNGCAASNTVISTVSVNTTPTITVNSATICSGSSVTIAPAGAASYTITGGNYTVSPNTTTSYTVSGSTNGCAANNAVSTISVNTTPTLTVNNATICSNNSVAIVPTGANSYTITGGNFTVTPLTTTSYSVTGQSAAGCAASNTVVSTVSVNTTPTLTVNSATVCSGNSVAIVPTGAGSYTITGGSYTVSPNVTTSYSVTGTGSNGCAASNTAVSTVSVNTTPTVTVNSATVCSGNSVAIVPTGAASYTITGNNYTVTPNTTTSYTVTGTTNGCSSANAVSTISVNTTPTITLNGGSICPGNSYTLAASGAGSYTYSGGANIVSPSTNTTYSATGTGTNGCPASNTAVATVSVVNTLTISVSGSTNVCSGRTTTLTATGAATYSWSTGIITNTIALSPAANTTYTVYGASGTCSNNAVVTLSVLTTPTVTVNSATICSGTSVTLVPAGASSYTITGGNFTVTPTANSSYSVIGSAVNGCVSNSVVSTVSVNTTPTVTVNSASICSGASATLVPAGASSYTITGGSLTVTPTANTAYTVSGTAVNGCVSSPVVSTITVYSLPTITVNSGAICPGNSFTLVPAGAATYTYSNGSNVIVNPVATAAYSITGTSAQGCHATNTAVATVSVVNTLSITVTGPAAICAGETATLTANGATTYSWNTGDATDNIIISPAATTDYTVSGASGTCSNTAVVTLSVNPLPTVTVNSGSVCLGSAFNILPTGADTYSISGNTFTVSPTATQSYSVTGTDLNGCVSAEVTSTVTVNALPVVTAAASNATMCISETASLTASGATTYLWSNTQTDAVIAVTATVAGTETYTVTGTDANGCMNTATVTQVFDNCTAIKKNVSAAFSFVVYPNPNRGQFTIETNENVKVEITNVIGQLIYTETTSGDKTTISIKDFDNGIYFIKASAKGSQHIVKIVKE